MPNNITNILTFTDASEKQIAEVLESIKNDKLGIGSVDFNKIIPMPPEIFRGNLGQEERELYGKNNWYDWSVANWGTKWNAYDFDYGNYEPYKEGNQIKFLTAWTRPEPVIQKLSELFPEIQIFHEWADEDVGMNVGEVLYEGGEIEDEYIPNGGSKEAYEMASATLGVELSEWGLYYSEDTDNYIYRDEEETEEMNL